MVVRLPGVDAGFLYMETPSLHMHTLKVALVDVSDLAGDTGLERLRSELVARLHLIPPFQRRLRTVPFHLHHPVWVQQGRLDDGYHLRVRRLPAPGTMAQLEQVIGEVAATPLDRSRPLWQMTLVEGLADGRVAVVTKMHHALADGMAANALLANVMDGAHLPAGQPVPPPAEPEPSSAQLVVAALREAVVQIGTLPPLLRLTARGVRAAVTHRRQSDTATPRPILDTPAVCFNGAITPARSFATASLSLTEARAVKSAFGVTLNDVVLAVVAGALRAWLDERGEHPSGPLTAGVPVATDPQGSPARLFGNRVSNLFTSLCTDLDDPVERLQAISRVTHAAKGLQRALGADLLERWVQFAPPAPFSAFMRLYSRWRAADLHAAPFNLVVSNVPGPTAPVTIAGARLTELYSVGPILEGIGLNITVWSYLDRLAFSALACPDTLADLPALTRHLAPALDVLVQRARQATC